MKKTVILLIAFIFTLWLVSCVPTTETSEYVVSFNTNSEDVIDDQIIETDGLVTEPSAITKESYIFQYWYASDESTPYDFDTPVSSDLELNALWIEVFQVTFNNDNDTENVIVDINDGSSVTRTTDPTKEGYTFAYWYVTDESVVYDFSTPVTEDLTLNAKWEITEAGIIMKINEDIAYATENLYYGNYQLNFEKRGFYNNSLITWVVSSKYILKNGTIIRVSEDTEDSVAMLTAKFSLDGQKIEKTFEIDLALIDVVISEVRTVPFENLTTEYEVEDGSLDLLFEENGTVPYVKLDDFFGLIQGFIDPEVDITKTIAEDEYVLEYQYYDEDEDYTYDLILTINTTENTISVNDPGFYWAYVYTTETNYGRHITSVDVADESYIEGGDLVFDLDDYGMDALFYEDSLVIPFYLTNQLFAGSSYYNIYYNTDNLYGLYSLPSQGSDEYELIQTSSMNSKPLAADLVVHNFNMLAFNLDNFYGLRDIMEVDTYYDLLYEYEDQMLATSAKTFDLGLFDIINKELDDPHTSYGSKSYFNAPSWDGPLLTSIDQLGPRVTDLYRNGIWAVQDEIAFKFLTDDPSSRPNYWFVDDDMETAVLYLDDFYTADIEEDFVYNADIVASYLDDTTETLLPVIDFGDKFFYHNSSTQDNDFAEVLIKHVDSTDFDNYEAALASFGYVYDSENEFYEITIGELVYTLNLIYYDEYNIIYLGLIQAELPNEEIGDVFEFVTDLIDFIYLDSAVYMEIMLEEIIEASPLVKNIILDLSYNMGGNVGALYRVVGFVTDQPFRKTSINVGTGSRSTTYTQIVGIDAYDHLNWALLTSPLTYSAGNELATIFVENNLGPVIGLQSGGGSASITPVLLPNGTAFTMSSNNLNGFRTGTGTEEDPYVYTSNEFGVTPDYIISIELIYDNDTLLDAIDQYYYGD